jgi:hypothetical protein
MNPQRLFTNKKGRLGALFLLALGETSRSTSGSVLLAEFVDAAAGVDGLLLARVERMAVRAHFDLQILAQRGARQEIIPAGAGDRDFFVFGMNAGFHDFA